MRATWTPPPSADEVTDITADKWRELDYAQVYIDDAGHLVVTGDPDEVWGDEDEESHSCDQMGCGFVGRHVLARATIAPRVKP